MRGSLAKRIRRWAEKATDGKPASETRRVYKLAKRGTLAERRKGHGPR